MRVGRHCGSLHIALLLACGASACADPGSSHDTLAQVGQRSQDEATTSSVAPEANSSSTSAGRPNPSALAGQLAAADNGLSGAAAAGRSANSSAGAAGHLSPTDSAGTSAQPQAGAASGGTTAASGPSAAGEPAGAGAPPSEAEPASCDPATAGAETPTIYVIGDSTASEYAANLHPRMGWAQPLQEYFSPACAKVEDKALSGRSSKSFYDEGAWSPIQTRLHPGDYVLIQFGHNDEKSEDRARYTEPFGSYQMYLSTYIDDALAAEATPILLTSIERNSWRNGELGETHGDYPEAVRQLADARQVLLVDMTALTHAYFERIGQAATTKLFMNLSAGESPNYPRGNSDNTHLQETGARIVAELALADLAHQRAPIASLLDHVPTP